jgi:hypothetical protein
LDGVIKFCRDRDLMQATLSSWRHVMRSCEL